MEEKREKISVGEFNKKENSSENVSLGDSELIAEEYGERGEIMKELSEKYMRFQEKLNEEAQEDSERKRVIEKMREIEEVMKNDEAKEKYVEIKNVLQKTYEQFSVFKEEYNNASEDKRGEIYERFKNIYLGTESLIDEFLNKGLSYEEFEEEVEMNESTEEALKENLGGSLDERDGSAGILNYEIDKDKIVLHMKPYFGEDLANDFKSSLIELASQIKEDPRFRSTETVEGYSWLFDIPKFKIDELFEGAEKVEEEVDKNSLSGAQKASLMFGKTSLANYLKEGVVPSSSGRIFSKELFLEKFESEVESERVGFRMENMTEVSVDEKNVLEAKEKIDYILGKEWDLSTEKIHIGIFSNREELKKYAQKRSIPLEKLTEDPALFYINPSTEDKYVFVVKDFEKDTRMIEDTGHSKEEAVDFLRKGVLSGIAHEMTHMHPFFKKHGNPGTDNLWEQEMICNYTENKIKGDFSEVLMEWGYIDEEKIERFTLEHGNWDFFSEEASREEKNAVRDYFYPILVKEYGLDVVREVWEKLQSNPDISIAIKEILKVEPEEVVMSFKEKIKDKEYLKNILD